jgi:hypothetical protein
MAGEWAQTARLWFSIKAIVPPGQPIAAHREGRRVIGFSVRKEVVPWILGHVDRRP